MTTIQFAPDVVHRSSKRGLVIAAPSGDTMLFEHPRAVDLPEMLDRAPTALELAERLGPPLQPGLIDELVTVGVLVERPNDTDSVERVDSAAGRTDSRPRVSFSRSGILFPGIAAPARWINHRVLPALISRPGRLALAAVVVAGIASLTVGRPAVPEPAAGPATQALLLLLIGLATSVLHEFGHAVALVHYGRTPRRAGFGFYWGALSFYVDSTPALTLPRRERVVQALAGLAVDVISTSVLAILAHALHNPLLVVVFWQRAVLDATAILVNALPVLEVDGHWALADALDEPDLSPRARAALAETLHGRRPPAGYGTAAYGAASLLAGLALLAVSALVGWHVLGELITALFAGGPADVLVGVYLVAPIVLGLAVSALGLALQSVATAVGTRAGGRAGGRTGVRTGFPRS